MPSVKETFCLISLALHYYWIVYTFKHQRIIISLCSTFIREIVNDLHNGFGMTQFPSRCRRCDKPACFADLYGVTNNLINCFAELPVCLSRYSRHSVQCPWSIGWFASRSFYPGFATRHNHPKLPATRLYSSPVSTRSWATPRPSLRAEIDRFKWAIFSLL